MKEAQVKVIQGRAGEARIALDVAGDILPASLQLDIGVLDPGAALEGAGGAAGIADGDLGRGECGGEAQGEGALRRGLPCPARRSGSGGVTVDIPKFFAG